MSFWFYVAAVALPFVGGLQRYAVSYGYAGNSKQAAFAEALRVGCS